MKKLLTLTAVAEVATGLALIVLPSIVVRLLLGAEPAGLAIPIARVAGIAIVALGFACWPGPPLLGMLIYSSLVTLYFLYLGIAGDWVGPLLWPAVALHALLTVLLARSWMEKRTTDRTDNKATINESLLRTARLVARAFAYAKKLRLQNHFCETILTDTCSHRA